MFVKTFNENIKGRGGEGGMMDSGNGPVPLDRLSDRFFKYL